mmetsp:Transcript_753/g.1251  ORF Transcript_753/g.1251 Transcript_753/m.1251 type:complete len:261 (+) Transcript_753:147-929(+)
MLASYVLQLLFISLAAANSGRNHNMNLDTEMSQRNTPDNTLEGGVEEVAYYISDDDGDDDVNATIAPTEFPTLSPTDLPTMIPTASPASTMAPTYRSHPTPTPTVSPTKPPSTPPTQSPSLAPSGRPTPPPVTTYPTMNPTQNKLLAELSYPRFFSATADTILIVLGCLVVAAWVVMGTIYVYRRYVTRGDKQHLIGTKVPKRKRIKKFEDYWDEESEDTTSKKFPNRAAATTTSYEDYWDENVDFSSHSHDALNFSRGL